MAGGSLGQGEPGARGAWGGGQAEAGQDAGEMDVDTQLETLVGCFMATTARTCGGLPLLSRCMHLMTYSFYPPCEKGSIVLCR